jgi:hypothetical protein
LVWKFSSIELIVEVAIILIWVISLLISVC